MGYYLAADQQDPVPLASLMGMRDLRLWVGSLPQGEFMSLRHLLEYAWEQDVDDLRAELAAALSAHAPQDADTRSTAAGLLSTLRAAGAVIVVTVTDGLGPDTGEEEEDTAAKSLQLITDPATGTVYRVPTHDPAERAREAFGSLESFWAEREKRWADLTEDEVLDEDARRSKAEAEEDAE
jgi:hypothetical protein